ncbi:MAG: ribonuclease HII [Candidatus Moranbacteria bacterium]|nr:ribonuclease HII [Candidatus Moranbacteria bacterium]
MLLPSTKEELRLSSQGYVIVGVDEVGRGPLAGPVVAAAAWVDPVYFEKDFKLRNCIRDSKTLSEKQRNEVFDFLEKKASFKIGIGEVTPKTIDRINILNASLLAMRLAVEDLVPKIKQRNVLLLIDGNKIVPGLNYSQRYIIKGDQKAFSIAVASIYAKVYRDNIMIEYHQKFPNYGFDTHKGYGTQKHMKALEENGACEIHRQSFGPVKNSAVF